MRYLLDTHAFLWWIGGDPRLSQRAAEVIRDPENEILVSAASTWEMAIKSQLGRIAFTADPVDLVPRQKAENRFPELPISVRHALQTSRLPLLHRDPFDRAPIAQAQVENIPLLSADETAAQYGVAVIW